MPLLKRLVRKPWVQRAVGITATEYMRLVTATNRAVFDPPDSYARIAADEPVIFAMWHGQHALVPFVRPRGQRDKVLISRHRDGEMNAVLAERMGIGTIRGSGDHGVDFRRKGGVSAFRQMLAALEDGFNMALTADVPKVSRVAGAGIVRLAQHSGRPILPVAVATSRRIELTNWDKSVINLPFGRLAVVVESPIKVAADADETALEVARQTVETRLNAATARAYAIVDRKDATQEGVPHRG
jgi:lysophospholipid acyltransferase (LPLAT)-like uncharacterized protein